MMKNFLMKFLALKKMLTPRYLVHVTSHTEFVTMHFLQLMRSNDDSYTS